MGIIKRKEPKKPSFVIAGGIIFIILVLLMGVKLSMDIKDYQVKHTPNPIETKKYEVRMQNWLGSSYYYCDSINKEEKSIKLFNVGEDDENITILIPENVMVYIKEL